MKAVLFERFGEMPKLTNVPDPTPDANGVVVKLEANGICRSDWHGWIGHDSDIVLPHVPGHELAGTVAAIGRNVTRWREGDRVTVPFVTGCGHCPECHSGNQQVCRNQHQPGFTEWGSFAEYVGIHEADLNLVALPDSMEFATAASLGCRFATSFRAVVDQARVTGGQWVAVHGSGGVGLSAIMIAAALGARVVAIDIADDKLELAQKIGAEAVINSNAVASVTEAVMEITGDGAHVSIDALGHPSTCFNSIACLRRHGRHVQVGLTMADQATPQIPMDLVISRELEIYGSHGMQAHRYDAMLEMIESGKLRPDRLIGDRINLAQSIEALTRMDEFNALGVTVITEF